MSSLLEPPVDPNSMFADETFRGRFGVSALGLLIGVLAQENATLDTARVHRPLLAQARWRAEIRLIPQIGTDNLLPDSFIVEPSPQRGVAEQQVEAYEELLKAMQEFLPQRIRL